jgi:hypothetical protein
MASVGGITCDIVRPNTPTANKQRVETWVVPGLNGIGAQKLGLNDAEWEFTLVEFDTKANVFSWAASIEALQGTIITIVDDWDRTYLLMLMTGASHPVRTPAIHAKTLGATGVRCEMTIKGKIT